VSEAAPSLRPQWIYLGLSVFVAVLWFATLPSRPLFNPDEGRYAEIPREMLAGGDWVIPHLNGLAYIEKPPLQYWATALSLRVFGVGEFAARFYTALCALGTVIAVGCIAKALWGAMVALRTAAVLSSLMLFVILGQLLTLDMSLTFYMTLALGAFLLAQREASAAGPRELNSRSYRGWMLLAWAATALGVLTKGLVAAAVPTAVLTLYSLWSRDVSPWRRLYLRWGLPLFLVIAVPWHWLAARRSADFLQFFFVHEHLSRYLTPSADREEAWWFFAVVFALGSIPWTLSALRVVLLGWQRRAPRGQFDATLFLWLWVVFVGVFFSLSDSKLIPYILPAMPALALLIGASDTRTLSRDVLWTSLLTILAGVALAGASLYGPRVLAATGRNQYFLMLAKPLIEVAALLVFSGVFVALQRSRDLTRAAVFLGVGWCLAGVLLMRAAGTVAPIYSGVVLARALRAPVPLDTPLYSVGTYDQTLPFYWQRAVKLVAYRGELDFGLRHDPSAEISDVGEFLGQWQDLSDGYAVMEIPMFDDLTRRGVPLREVARDIHRVLAARR
jgi:4-amino-4-deoxy-L-arabinose transferase-like glycosyltransferase